MLKAEMALHTERRGWFVAVVLCALIAAVSVVSPLCPACDGLGSTHADHVHLADKGVPVADDGCNGVCSCCGFHLLPSMQRPLPVLAAVTELLSVKDEQSVNRLPAPPFLPPRV